MLYKEVRVCQSLKQATLESDKKIMTETASSHSSSWQTTGVQLYTWCFPLQSEVSVLGPSHTKGPSQGTRKDLEETLSTYKNL